MPTPLKTRPRPVGIDIGGSGIKGAVVDPTSGRVLGGRLREPTPKPSTPDAVTTVVRELADRISTDGPIGVTLPGVVCSGTIETAANVDPSWVGVDAGALLEANLGRPVALLNDADAAGMAEMAFGAGRGRPGVVMMVTLGTGIGSALFLDGRLVANSEFGHITVSGKDGEKLAASSVRAAKNLSWKAWSKRLNAYLARLETLLSLDLIIIGGGVSKHHAHFLPRLKTRAEVVPAGLLNDAGIIGAALATAAPAGAAEPWHGLGTDG